MDLSIKFDDQSIEIIIDDKNIINDYKNSDNKQLFIKTLIENGYRVSNCLQLVTNTCGCCEQISELSDIFNTGGNSSKNGQIGEIFASELFTKRNPDINYIDTAKIPKSGDAIIDINNHSISKIMIDYKNYDSQIPSDEIIKLKRDMDAQNINYGILLSYNSKISKKKYIDYEIIGNKIIVYVASYGMDILSLEMSIQYLQRLYECQILSISQKVSDLVSQGVTKEITDIYENLYKLACELSQDTNIMKENQDKLNKMFYGMINNNQNRLSTINVLIDTAKNKMKELNKESISNIHSFSELIQIVERIIDKEKDVLLSKRLLNLINDMNIDGYYSDKDNCIHFSTIGKLEIKKSKLTMIFYKQIDDLGRCYWNPNYESIKNDNIYIQLSNDPKIWDCINNRLN